MGLPELAALIQRFAEHEGETPLGECAAVSRITQPGVPESSVTGVMFVLLAQGAKELAVGDRTLLYRGGQSLITSVEVPVTGRFMEASPEHPALGFGLRLRPSLIAEMLLERGAPEPHTGGLRSASGLVVHDASPRLIDAVGRMVTLLATPEDLPVLGPLIEREITWLLLRGPQGEAVGHLGRPASPLRRIGPALTWLRGHYAEPITVAELAQMSSLSPSGFHRMFRAVTALTPIQYQKQLRLQEARLRLFAAPSEVARVAHDVGYESASQFSRDYKRHYGLPPLRDATRLGRAET